MGLYLLTFSSKQGKLVFPPHPTLCWYQHLWDWAVNEPSEELQVENNPLPLPWVIFVLDFSGPVGTRGVVALPDTTRTTGSSFLRRS